MSLRFARSSRTFDDEVPCAHFAEGRPERRRSFSSKLFLPVPGQAHRLSQIYSCECLFVDFETASPTERSRLGVRPDAKFH
jgi:hypothetical protein